MTTRGKRMVLYGGAALFTAAFISWIVAQVAPPTAAPGIAFVGLTNSSKGTLAQFRITNSLGYPSYLGVAPVEIESGGGWPTTGVPAGVMMFKIPRGSVTNILIAAPAGNKRWRLPVGYSQRPSRMESSVRTVTSFVGWEMPNWHSNMHRVYTTYSSPVQP